MISLGSKKEGTKEHTNLLFEATSPTETHYTTVQTFQNPKRVLV